ncbi:MAG TPA: HAMP domain-containing sensor histidine kinase [Rhizomicrobium sp.]
MAIVSSFGFVLGLVNRLRFLARYSLRYYPELYSKRSVLELANSEPLIVDEQTHVADLGVLLVLDQPDALAECFVVSRRGRYLGIGTGEALMRSKVALLQAREAELQTALDAATEASRIKTSFLAMMSHELRTPLNAILGFSEVIGSELLGPLGSARYREYAGDIHNAGKHLLALISDILDISKAEAGKLDLQPEAFDLAELVQECMRLVRDRADAQRLKLSLSLMYQLPFLLADRLRVKQILLNLLSNAIKFTEPGGTIAISAAMEEAAIVLSVADTGIGMAPEQIPIALTPFRQLSSSHSRNAEGTGLGLPLVKSLIELHGGRLWIESRPSNGTTVTVLFPECRTVRPALALTA